MWSLTYLTIAISCIIVKQGSWTKEDTCPLAYGICLYCQEREHDLTLRCWLTGKTWFSVAPQQIDVTFLSCENTDANYYNEVFKEYNLKLEPITKLTTNNCNVSTLDIFRPLINLKEIFIESEEIETISSHLTNSKLEKLNVWNSSVKSIQQEAFKNLVNLKTIFLDHNRLEKIPPKVFMSLKYLKVISLSDNKLADIENVFNRLKSIELINLSKNFITSITIETFIYSPKLQKLDLSLNRIQQIHEAAFFTNHYLDELQINRNNEPINLKLFLEHFSDRNKYQEDMTRFLLISLKNCNITKLDLSGVFNFKKLVLQLSYVNINVESSLKLPINTNLTVSIAASIKNAQAFQWFLNSSSLREIFASENYVLANFDEFNFKGDYVEIIHLDQCNIKTLNLIKLFRNFPKLKKFTFSNNGFTHCHELIGDFNSMNKKGVPFLVDFTFENRLITCNIDG